MDMDFSINNRCALGGSCRTINMTPSTEQKLLKEKVGYCSICGKWKSNLNGYGVCKVCRNKKKW